MTLPADGVTLHACRGLMRRCAVEHPSTVRVRSLNPLTMPGATSYDTAFARLRDVFTLYQKSPGVLVNSLELQDYTRDASRAALVGGVPFVALRAEFGRVAAESLPHDRMTAIRVGRAMMRWAGPVYDWAAMDAG